MRKTILLKVLFLLGINLFLLANGCKKTTVSEDYLYLKGFQSYLNDINLKHKGDVIYYVIRLQDCMSCTSAYNNLKVAANLATNEHLKIIIVGETKLKHLQKEINAIKNSLYLDHKSEIFNYETGFSKPLLVHLNDNSKLEYYMEITDFKILDAKKYIESRHK